MNDSELSERSDLGFLAMSSPAQAKTLEAMAAAPCSRTSLFGQMSREVLQWK
jgi:hypothetical protein